MQASWAECFHTAGALKSHSDVAVAARVMKVLGQSVADQIPYTDFQLSVESVLYDPSHHFAPTAAPTTLLLHQTGGILNSQLLEIEDDPLLIVGGEYVLFLDEYAPGYYRVAGGPTGRFTVNAAGLVSPFVSDGVAFSGQVRDFQSVIAGA
ncbi:MAG TPA: hypothetical protein VGX23_22945 [Actinocrinis sp.]|nr:hypothetical protein [Actinocrinis sp.]